MVPQPVYALLLLFPVTPELDAAAEEGLLQPREPLTMHPIVEVLSNDRLHCS